MAMTSAGVLVSAATQATKQLWKAFASSVAKISPSRSCGGAPSVKGRNRRRSELLLANPRDIAEGLRTGQNRQQRQQKNFIQRINHLAGLTMVWQLLEIIQKNGRLDNQSEVPRRIRHRRSPPIESVDHDRFSTSCLCHALLHPITLVPSDHCIYRSRAVRYRGDGDGGRVSSAR